MTWAAKILEEPAYRSWPTPRRFVLFMMANRADEEGMLFPSVRWVMERTNLSESAVRTATRDIQRAGLLTKEFRRRDDGGQGANIYRLAMSQFVLRLEVNPGAPDAGGVAGKTPRGASGVGAGVHPVQGPGAYGAPQDTKEETKEKKKDGARATRLPTDFKVSDNVRVWAKVNGHEPYLEAHFAYFILDAQSRSTAKYVDWDKALMKAITADWGNVRKQAEWAARAAGQPSALARGPLDGKPCRYCPRPAVGAVGGVPYCGADGHSARAMDGEPAPAKVAA